VDVSRQDQRVKILLDVTSVTPPLSGIGRYTLELARHLPDSDGVEDFAFLRGNQVQAEFSAGAVSSPRPASRLRQWVKPLLPYKLLLQPYRRYKARALAGRLRDYQDYIFHSPNFTLPTLTGRSVVTLHDLSVFHFPDFHPRDRVNYLRDQINYSVERADRLVADSEFVRQELLALFQLSPAKVIAIALGVDASFRQHGSRELAAVMGRHGLAAGSYLLSVGTIEPRKNLAGLLRAYGQLDQPLRRRYPLVVAGGYGWNSGALMAEIRRLRLSGEVIYLDYVPEQELPAIYAGATAFCYFSFYEGFGLPVLEAMSSGVPVVCANTSALPELVADAGLQVDPHDDRAMAGALRRALEDGAWRETARAKGLARSSGYTWARTSEQLVEVFRGLASAGEDAVHG
jgi:glycosyltransferase involved in cell wall biosynthesis